MNAVIRGLDIRKAETALKRAAEKSVHGSREERSGRVVSSALANIEYDRPARMLEVRFVNGRTYRYADVPPDVYEALMNAGSKGLYFNSQIRNRYHSFELPSRF